MREKKRKQFTLNIVSSKKTRKLQSHVMFQELHKRLQNKNKSKFKINKNKSIQK